MKVLLIGTADLTGEKIGGQLEKTRLVHKFLRKEEGMDIEFINMMNDGRGLGLITKVINKYRKNDCVVVITSSRGTRMLSTIFSILYLIKKKPIVYLIVGNQQDLLKSFSKMKRRSIAKVYFEVDTMQDELRDKYNVGYFSNCKEIHVNDGSVDQSKPLKICYYSEVSKRKGFDLLIDALDEVNKDFHKYTLDVYGFFSSDENDMRKLLNSREYADFKGTIKRELSQNTLSQYCFMVFPSRHKQEGVPGAIVDAYEAGLPVISSNVGFLPQVVKNEQTGFLFEEEGQLVNLLEEAYTNSDMVDRFRMNALEEAKKYDIKESIKKLHTDLIEMI